MLTKPLQSKGPSAPNQSLTVGSAFTVPGLILSSAAPDLFRHAWPLSLRPFNKPLNGDARIISSSYPSGGVPTNGLPYSARLIGSPNSITNIRFAGLFGSYFRASIAPASDEFYRSTPILETEIRPSHQAWAALESIGLVDLLRRHYIRTYGGKVIPFDSEGGGGIRIVETRAFCWPIDVVTGDFLVIDQHIISDFSAIGASDLIDIMEKYDVEVLLNVNPLGNLNFTLPDVDVDVNPFAEGKLADDYVKIFKNEFVHRINEHTVVVFDVRHAFGSPELIPTCLAGFDIAIIDAVGASDVQGVALPLVENENHYMVGVSQITGISVPDLDSWSPSEPN